jgi:Spy/CpxP family protein refolding chaperone
MRVRVWMWMAVGVLAAAGTVAMAAAQERPRRPARPDAVAIEKALGLTAEQADQLRKLRAEGRKQAIRHRADTEIARLELEELMGAPTVDEKAVAAKVKVLADLQAAGLLARTTQRLAMRRLLTPEQQEKLRQLAPRRSRGARPARAWRGRSGAPGIAPRGPCGPWWDEGDEPQAPAPEP